MSKKNILQQFKGLQPNNPGSWPLAPKLVCLATVFCVVIAGGYFLDTQAQLADLDAGRLKEETLKTDYVDKYKQAASLDLYKRQLVEVDQSFGALLKQLPDRSKMEGLITDINQAGVSRGLSFELFKPDASETRREFYAELPIALRVIGDYHKMGLFASDISKLSRIVTLNDISLSVGKDGNLQMEAVAKTFRYLDEEEIAAQRKTDAEAKPKSKAKS